MDNMDYLNLYREDQSQYDISKDQSFHQNRELNLMQRLLSKVTTDAERIAVKDYILILEYAIHLNLNWRQCRFDNQILALLEKYNLK